MQGTWALTLRSLRQDSRLLRFHLLRLAVVSALACIVFAAWDSVQYSEAPGRDLLEALGWANFWAVTIAGVLLFAPTITEEKEDQTLGLLRMTGIGPASLLLGKALPKLVQLLLILIVQLPLVWLTLTLGGVDWPLMINVYLLVFGQLIGVVAISLLASVMMRTSGGAVVVAGALVFCWSLGSLILEEELRYAMNQGSVWATMLHPAAFDAAQIALPGKMDALLRSGATVPGTPLALGVNLTGAGLLSLFCMWSFNYWNQHESTQTELEWVQEKWQRVWFRMTHFRLWGSLPQPTPIVIERQPVDTNHSLSTRQMPAVESCPTGRSRRSARSWQSAIAWKDYFLLGGGWTGMRVRCWITAIVSSGIFLLILRPQLSNWVSQEGAFGWDSIQFILHFTGEPILTCSAWAFGLDLVYLTVNLFAYELRRQTWESLQLLPLPLGAISRRKILGAACHLVPWVIAFLCGLALNVTTDDVNELWRDANDDPLATLGIVLQVVTQFVTALLVLTWFSLRFNPWIAILLTGALYWAIGIGWIITALMTFGFMSSPGPYYVQVLFHVGWIGGITLLGGGTLWSIRSKLRGEAASV